MAVELAPGQTKGVVFLLGMGTWREARCCVGRFRSSENVDGALADVRAIWESWVEASRVQTPDPALDLMTNRLLKYQAVAGRCC